MGWDVWLGLASPVKAWLYLSSPPRPKEFFKPHHYTYCVSFIRRKISVYLFLCYLFDILPI